MKYLKKFQTNADYQAFRGGGDWITPNISIIVEDDSIVFEPFVNNTDSITFPVYLVKGDNGQLGKDVHSYLVSKFHEVGMTTYDITETIYVNDIIMYVADSPAPLEAVHNTYIYLHNTKGGYYGLSTTGVVIDMSN